MADAAAKDAKAQLKAAKQAEKARKKASTDPADMGRLKQIRRAYQLTHEHDRALPFLLLGAFLLPIAICVVVGLLWDHMFNLVLIGVMLGVLAAMIMLVRRAKAATFKRYAGQAGSAEVALQMLPKQWISTPVIAANRNRDVVHRTLGPGGLVLIGEGEPGRVRQLLAGEVKKHERVAYGITVTTVLMGDKEGQVPVEPARRPHPQAAQDAAAESDHRPEAAASRPGRGAPARAHAQGSDADQPATGEGRPSGHARPLSRGQRP